MELTDLEVCEAAFIRTILSNPSDVTARLVFADWLDDYYPERRVQAKYLREIRKHKFIRLVRDEGEWALRPQWAEDRGPRIPKYCAYDGFGTNAGDRDGVSPRCKYWMKRIRRGWKVPRHIKTMGYSTATGWFGVYVREYLDHLSPILWYHT